LWPISKSRTEKRMTTENYHHRAESYLGDIFLRQNRDEKALEIFQKLVRVDQMFKRFHTTGQAGMAIVYDRMDPNKFAGKEEEKKQKLSNVITEVIGSGMQVQLADTPYIKTEYQRLLEKLRRESEIRSNESSESPAKSSS